VITRAAKKLLKRRRFRSTRRSILYTSWWKVRSSKDILTKIKIQI